jgi:hypothetical protein
VQAQAQGLVTARAQLPHWWALRAWWVRLLPEREQVLVLVLVLELELER